MSEPEERAPAGQMRDTNALRTVTQVPDPKLDAQMSTVDTVALSAWLLLVGVLFGFLANILVSRGSYKTRWMGLFYVLGLASLCCCWAALAPSDHHGLAWLGFLISVAYFPTLRRMTHPKEQFSTKELDPKVIEFTADADEGVLKLFFGDVNCFGNSPGEMDKHPQYQQLRDHGFKALHILCERPRDAVQRLRYGKIFTDFGIVVMKHYNNTTAWDLDVRGRIKKAGPGPTDRIQLYKRIRTGSESRYEAVEHDSNHAVCTLYVKLWDMLWTNADPATATDIEEWRALYRK